MKFLKASLALALCGYLPQPAESRPITGLRGNDKGKSEDESEDDNEVLLTDVGQKSPKKVPAAKSPLDIFDPNLGDPNNIGMMEARPDLNLDLDRFERFPIKTRPKPNPCCEGNDHPGFADPAYTEYKDCMEEVGSYPQQEVSRLKWAVRYLRAAVGSKPFETCLRDAVQKKVHLKTSHEHDWVGPYVPCSGPDLEDPEFILDSRNPEYVAYDVVMNTARFAGSTSKRKLKLECHDLIYYGGNEFSMWSPSDASNRWDYDFTRWGVQKTHLVEVSRKKVMGQYPDHAQGQNDWPEIFGTVGFCDHDDYNGHSYPVDEISGMILHEMLHNINLNHGDGGNQCRYDSYNCDDHGSGTCRANSLNEIAEACVSEVVEESIRRCHPERCCHRYQVPIWVDGDISLGDRRNLAVDKNIYDLDLNVHKYPFGSCECESFW